MSLFQTDLALPIPKDFTTIRRIGYFLHVGKVTLTSRKELIVDVENCTGCMSCVTMCSYVKKGTFKPLDSRIRITMKEEKMLNIPTFCFQCEKPPCADVCPVKAIVKNRRTGLVDIAADLCIGCKACISVCPFGAMTVDYDEGIAAKCDLCNGHPECVKVCTVEALQYTQLGRSTILKKSHHHNRYLKTLATILESQEVP